LNRNNPDILQHQSAEITSIIQSFVPSACCDSDTNLNILKYILPFGEQKKFSELFSQLEKLKDIKVCSHNKLFIFPLDKSSVSKS